jgi:hypothetical protein
MAGEAAGDRWITASRLIEFLQTVPPDTLCRTSPVTGGVVLYRGDDPRPTWEGMLGWIDLLTESIDIDPNTSDDDWPEVRDSPITIDGALANSA